jgi:hypothetical protein
VFIFLLIARALPVNAYFFKMRPFLWLPLRLGLAVPFQSSTLIFSGRFQQMTPEEAMELFAHYRTSLHDNGLQWNEEKLYQRLSVPRHVYGIHATQNLLLISSPRSTRRVKYTLLCGFFIRADARVAAANVGVLVRAACHFGSSSRIRAVPYPCTPGQRSTSTVKCERPDRSDSRFLYHAGFLGWSDTNEMIAAI